MKLVLGKTRAKVVVTIFFTSTRFPVLLHQRWLTDIVKKKIIYMGRDWYRDF